MIEKINYEYDNRDNFMNNIVFITNKQKIFKISNYNFKRYFKWYHIKSFNYKIKKEKDKLIVNGRGRGNSIGFCQWGAYHLSIQNVDFNIIINHYLRINGILF